MVKKKLARVSNSVIAEEAWRLAYLKEASFTANGLAARLKMPANRHFRQYLNSLAASGLLQVARQLCEDGYYRKYFYAQRTTGMFTFEEKERIS